MTNRERWLLTVILFPALLCLLIALLKPLATGGWLGPVLAQNLENRLDAGSLQRLIPDQR